MKYTTYLQIFFVYIILVILAGTMSGQSSNYDFLKIILSMASFVFAILLGFAISNRHKRFMEIRHSLREDDAYLLNSYRSATVFGKRSQNKVRKLIDDYLISQIDYKLVDYRRSTYLLAPIHDFILRLKAKTEIQKVAQDKMLDNIQQSTHISRHVVYWLKDRVTRLEWISIISLYLVIMIVVLYLNDHQPFSVFIIPVVGATLFIPILILRNLNNLTWQSQDWDWKPLTRIFIELGLSPYYPYSPAKTIGMINYLKDNQVKKYRVATYPSKYPTIDDKQVETIELG